MRGHQIERAKFGAPAKPFESQRRAFLCQEVRWNPVAGFQLYFCVGVSAVYRDHINTGMCTMSNYCLCNTMQTVNKPVWIQS